MLPDDLRGSGPHQVANGSCSVGKHNIERVQLGDQVTTLLQQKKALSRIVRKTLFLGRWLCMPHCDQWFRKQNGPRAPKTINLDIPAVEMQWQIQATLLSTCEKRGNPSMWDPCVAYLVASDNGLDGQMVVNHFFANAASEGARTAKTWNQRPQWDFVASGLSKSWWCGVSRTAALRIAEKCVPWLENIAY